MRVPCIWKQKSVPAGHAQSLLYSEDREEDQNEVMKHSGLA